MYVKNRLLSTKTITMPFADQIQNFIHNGRKSCLQVILQSWAGGQSSARLTKSVMGGITGQQNRDVAIFIQDGSC